MTDFRHILTSDELCALLKGERVNLPCLPDGHKAVALYLEDIGTDIDRIREILILCHGPLDE